MAPPGPRRDRNGLGLADGQMLRDCVAIHTYHRAGRPHTVRDIVPYCLPSFHRIAVTDIATATASSRIRLRAASFCTQTFMLRPCACPSGKRLVKTTVVRGTIIQMVQLSVVPSLGGQGKWTDLHDSCGLMLRIRSLVYPWG